MKAMRRQKSWVALLALLFIFAACKGESPTAPPPGGGPGPTPTPTTGFGLTLTASNANPVVDSIVVITAVVTQNGQPAPDGTAVEFAATGGSFSPTEIVTSILRTTTNGVARVELRSTVAGPIRVQAAVGNVVRTVDVTFKVTPTDIPPISTAPAITSVSPAIGIPSGGQRVIITGKNFKVPVRVLFDVGGPLPVEAFVISATETQIEVFTPSVNLGAGQQLISDITVITQAGSVNEQRATLADAFTFRNEQLTPRVSTATPNSGPIDGGTRVSIIGDGFQHPVQVLFGAAEARVIGVEFNEIIVEAPAGRDTADTGSGPVTGFVNITVRNINSQTETTLDRGFRYIAAMDITGFRPVTGPATGGTDVVIDGIGFNAPVDVTIGGVRATVLQVAGTRILARTGALPSSCTGGAGAVRVTNIDNGDTASADDTFAYIGIQPLITAVIPDPSLPGGSVTVTVRDPGVGALGSSDIRFNVNGRTLIPGPDRIVAGSGLQDFAVTLPVTGFTFPTESCTTTGGLPGTRFGPTEVNLTFNNVTNGCTATTTINIAPPAPNACLSTPQPSVTTPAGGTCAAPETASVTGVGFPSTTTAPIVISNGADSQPLNITSVAISGSNAAEFRISPTSASNIGAGGSANFILTFDPTTAGTKDAVVTFNTNSTTTPTLTVCVQTTAAP